jgi:hypothetical protein
MKRKIQNFLESWKNSPHRKPLVLQGARQVGNGLPRRTRAFNTSW